jgi:ABC-type multidrug transport system ATPase subunit
MSVWTSWVSPTAPQTTLLGSPELLQMDEPTNGLERAGIAQVRALPRSLIDAGTTVLIPSQLLEHHLVVFA